LLPPQFIEPCLPTISRTVPTGRQWAYEIKHDGFRFLAVRERERVRVYSRGGVAGGGARVHQGRDVPTRQTKAVR
jgi:ATP-dependent DNA ligase